MPNVDGQSRKGNPYNVYFHGTVDWHEARPFLIQDLIPQVGTGILSGQWGTFKTSVALEIAHSVMVGREFLGHDVVRRGGVLFFALEGQSEIAIRIQAVIDARQVTAGNQPFAWVLQCPQLINGDSAAQLVEIGGFVAQQLTDRFDLPLSMIVVDTLITAAGYYKEGLDSDAAATQAVVNTLALASQELGCFVLAVDHFGKNVETGTRGSSAKEGAADVVFAILADRDISGNTSNHRLAIRKNRYGPAGQEFAFKSKIVDMGEDQHGRGLRTVILDWGVTTTTKERKPPKSCMFFLRILDEATITHGSKIKPYHDGPEVMACPVDLVREEYEAQSVGDPETIGRTFRRAIAAAQASNLVAVATLSTVKFVWRI